MFSRPLPGWPTPPPEVRWGLREAFLCLAGAQIIQVFWVTALLVIFDRLEIGTESLEFILGATIGLWLAYFLAPALVSKSLGRGPRVDFDIGIEPKEAFVAIITGIALQLVVLPALYWPISKLTDDDAGEAARELMDKVDGPLDVTLLALAVVLIAPVVEERFYRGMLLPALTRVTGPAVGMLGSSLIFALVHQEWILIPGLMLLAVILSWMTVATGRIGPAIVAHMAFNASTVIGMLITT